MTPAEPTGRRWWMWVMWLLAGAVGLKYGFEFGLSISGVWMGLAMAITTALFSTLMADGLVQWLMRLRGGRREDS
jgi:hypothetical protein